MSHLAQHPLLQIRARNLTFGPHGAAKSFPPLEMLLLFPSSHCSALCEFIVCLPHQARARSALNLEGLEQCLARKWHLVDICRMIDSGRLSLNSWSEFLGLGRRILHRRRQGAIRPIPRHSPGPLLAGGHPGTHCAQRA